MVMRNQPTLFIQKLWDILNKGQNQSISWNDDGLTFLIKNQLIFQQQILATHFSHSNYASFIRQLNMYSFKKIRKNKVHQEFFHQLFRKNHRELLVGIKRKASQQDVLYGKKLLKKAGLCPGYLPSENSVTEEVVLKKHNIQTKQFETVSPNYLIINQSPAQNSKITMLWDTFNMNRFYPVQSKDTPSQIYPNNNIILPTPIFCSSPIYSPTTSFLSPNTFDTNIYSPVQNYSQMFVPTPYYSHPINLIRSQIVPSSPFAYSNHY